MSHLQKDIDSYAIQYLSTKDGAGHDMPLANIHCFNGESHEMVATLRFLNTGTLPLNGYDPSSTSNVIYIYFHISLFHDIIDIFRYEKPLQINFDESTLEGWLSTKDFESIGEQEH